MLGLGPFHPLQVTGFARALLRKMGHFGLLSLHSLALYQTKSLM